MQKIKEFISNNRWAQFVLVGVAGIAVGALFYPTKHIEETITQKYEEILAKEKLQHSDEMSKTTEDFLHQLKTSLAQTKELETKISSLTTEVKNLKSKQKTAYYKVVKPDGTIEIKKFTESEVTESTKVITQIQQEFKEKIATIETKWETIHKQRLQEVKSSFDLKEKEYQSKIAEYESKKVVDINPKKAGLELGATTKGAVYIHPSYDIFGPLFLGVHVEGAPNGSEFGAGAGVGIKF